METLIVLTIVYMSQDIGVPTQSAMGSTESMEQCEIVGNRIRDNILIEDGDATVLIFCNDAEDSL